MRKLAGDSMRILSLLSVLFVAQLLPVVAEDDAQERTEAFVEAMLGTVGAAVVDCPDAAEHGHDELKRRGFIIECAVVESSIQSFQRAWDLGIETDYAAYAEPTGPWSYGKRKLAPTRSGFGDRLYRNYLRQYRLDKLRELVVEVERVGVDRHLISLVIALPDPHAPEDP
jgi:hypothetical protein